MSESIVGQNRNDNELRANLFGIEPCPDNKVRGAIIIKKNNDWGRWRPPEERDSGIFPFENDFDVNFECICGTHSILPIPIFAIKTLISNLFKNKGPKFVIQYIGKPTRWLMWESIRRNALVLINRNLNINKKWLAAYRNKMNFWGQKVFQLREEVEIVQKKVLTFEQSANSLKNNIEELNAAAKNLSCGSIATPDMWKLWIDNANAGNAQALPMFAPEFWNCWAVIAEYWRLRPMLKQTLKDLDSTLRPELDEKLRLLKKAQKKEDFYIDKVIKYENFVLTGEAQKGAYSAAVDMEDLDAIIENLPPEVQTGALGYLMDALFIVLEAISIVQEKNCTGNIIGLPDGIKGANLNEDTCECSVCENTWKLCDLNSWVEYWLPNTPGSRMSDELNVCIQCCGDASPSPRFWSGGFIGSVGQELFGIPPCTCQCPSQVNGVEMDWLDCSLEGACEKGVCREKNAPPGKIWSAEECKYVDKCVSISCSDPSTPFGPDCNKPGMFEHTIRIPDAYSLPVEINISGSVNDDLLIDGQSITTTLGLDPGPYPNTVGVGCVGAHTIGEKPGPYQDPNGGITFPFDRREFVVSVSDTIGAGAGLDITICVDPNGNQGAPLAPLVTGDCVFYDTRCVSNCASNSDCAEGCHCVNQRPVDFSSCFGSGAAATATVENGVVASVSLTSGGSGYATTSSRSQPTVTASVAGGAGASFAVSLAEQDDNPECPTLRSWGVESVSVTNGGSGYTDQTPVSFSADDGDIVVSHAVAYAYVAVEEPRATVEIRYSPGTGCVLEPQWAPAIWQGLSSRGWGQNPPFCNPPRRTTYTITGFTVKEPGSGYSVDDLIWVEFSSNNDGNSVSVGVFYVDTVDQNGGVTSAGVFFGGTYGGAYSDRLEEVVVESCADGSGKYYRDEPGGPIQVSTVVGFFKDISIGNNVPVGFGAAISAVVEDDENDPRFGQVVSVSVVEGGSGYTGRCVSN